MSQLISLVVQFYQRWISMEFFISYGLFGFLWQKIVLQKSQSIWNNWTTCEMSSDTTHMFWCPLLFSTQENLKYLLFNFPTGISSEHLSEFWSEKQMISAIEILQIEKQAQAFLPRAAPALLARLWGKHAVEMVFCYQNCSDLLWEKIVLVIEKNFWSSRLKAENLQNFWDH